jgi:hypothetical protein
MIMSLAKKIFPLAETEKLVFSEKAQQALSSLALEGIDLPLESLEDIALLEAGKLSKERFIEKTLAMIVRT